MTWREFRKRQRVASVGNRFISYIDEGRGEAVILLHGFPTWGFVFHQFIDALRESYRVLIPDLPGFGFSDKSDRFDRSVARQTELVVEWMDQVKVARAAVAGHDVGGGIALRLATLFRERVTRLCVMNTICYDSWPIEWAIQLGHPGARQKLATPAAMTGLRSAFKKGFAGKAHREFLDGLLAPYGTEVGRLSLVRNASALNTNHTTEITGLLPTIRVPTLVLWGEEDRFQPVKYGAWLARDIPHARLVRVSRAGHFVMFDQPQIVAHELTTFLAGEGPQVEETGEVEATNRLRDYFHSTKEHV